jgi:hypothetical protein
MEIKAFHELTKKAVASGHRDTVTIIGTTTGSIFRGYAPVAWAPDHNGYLSDDRLEIFVFTIRNPHGLSPRIFAQKEADYAILDHPGQGPRFVGGPDCYVCDKCNSSNSNCSNLGLTFENETVIPGKEVLTGAENFCVKEIEVFEVVGSG